MNTVCAVLLSFSPSVPSMFPSWRVGRRSRFLCCFVCPSPLASQSIRFALPDSPCRSAPPPSSPSWRSSHASPPSRSTPRRTCSPSPTTRPSSVHTQQQRERVAAAHRPPAPRHGHAPSTTQTPILTSSVLFVTIALIRSSPSCAVHHLREEARKDLRR